MSKAVLFNNIQRKYLQKEKSLSQAGESEAETPKFNKIQKKYLKGIDASPAGSAGEGLAPPDPFLSFRTGAHTGEKSRPKDLDEILRRSAPQNDRGDTVILSEAKDLINHGIPRRRLGMTGSIHPKLNTMEFRPVKIRPEEKLYSLASERQRLSPVEQREELRDFETEKLRLKKTKQHPIPAPAENDPVSTEPIEEETPRQQTRRYDAQTGKTWFDCGGKEVWANMETLQGVGVLPDGTFINAAQGDRFAKPVYDVIYQRDSGQISKEEADKLLDAYAWEIAGSEYPNEADLSLRNENYLKTSERLKSRTIDYYSIPDITDKFNNMIESQEESILKDLSKWGLKVEGEHIGKSVFLRHFFRSGAKYDLKVHDEYQQHSLFIFNGEIMSRDDFGNLLFGYLGTACGMSEETLLLGAGVYQVRSGTSKPEWGESGGDDPRDSARISEGIKMYYEMHPGISQSERERLGEEETLRESESWWLY